MQPENNQKALWSLILGILGLVSCGIITGIPAIILAKQADEEIAASMGRQGGEGLAKGGRILGWISVGLTAFVAVIWLVIVLIAVLGSNT